MKTEEKTRMSSGRKALTVIVVIVLLAAAIAGAAYASGGHAIVATFWSLVPPLIAIIMALVTKEVYSSLLVGILLGNFYFAFAEGKFSFEGFFNGVFFSDGGIVTNLADSWNVGIMVFLVVLGILVALMNKAGGASAFGRWAGKHIKTRVGAELATVVLGVLIFVDDYFNCLTVGSVMRPITDSHKVSRAKLAYLIDATAAPVCIIAPVSSWAAAVSSYVSYGNGLTLFIKAIPFNFYALLTIVMMVFLALTGLEYGPVAGHERNAQEKGDIFSGM